MRLLTAIPVYNESKYVVSVLDKIRRFHVGDIVVIDDGSTDGTCDILASIDDIIRIRHPANQGYGKSLIDAFAYADRRRYDWVVTMDSDFEDKPEHIADLYRKALEGYDVVYAVRESKHKSFLKDIGSRLFYFLISRISTVPLTRNAGNFGIMRQDVVRALRKMTERTRYFAGLRTWVGFTQIGIDLPRGKRLAGRPKQSLSRLFKQALDAVFAFSTVPLKLLTLLGVVAFFSALFIAVMIVILRLIHPGVSIEWAPTIIVIVFVGGIQLIGLGILGEYLSRIYDEVRARPVSIVKTLTNAKQD